MPILLKPGKLDEVEWAVMRLPPMVGEAIIVEARIDDAWAIREHRAIRCRCWRSLNWGRGRVNIAAAVACCGMPVLRSSTRA